MALKHELDKHIKSLGEEWPVLAVCIWFNSKADRTVEEILHSSSSEQMKFRSADMMADYIYSFRNFPGQRVKVNCSEYGIIQANYSGDDFKLYIIPAKTQRQVLENPVFNHMYNEEKYVSIQHR